MTQRGETQGFPPLGRVTAIYERIHGRPSLPVIVATPFKNSKTGSFKPSNRVVNGMFREW